MAASYRILPSENLKLVRIRGRTDYRELEALFYTYLRDPLFRPELRLLVDLREMTDAVTGLWEISKLKQLYQYAYADAEDVVPVMIVTGGPIAQRAAQTFAIFMRDKRPMNIRITRDWSEALALLGLDEARLAGAVPAADDPPGAG